MESSISCINEFYLGEGFVKDEFEKYPERPGMTSLNGGREKMGPNDIPDRRVFSIKNVGFK